MSQGVDTACPALLEALLDGLPFGMAVLEQTDPGAFRYILANPNYETHAARTELSGASYGDVRLQGWPSVEHVEGVHHSGESWWERDLLGDGRQLAPGVPRPYLRALMRFPLQDRFGVLDLIVDTDAPFVGTTLRALQQTLEQQQSTTQAGIELVHASLIARVAALASGSLTLQSICERTLAGIREQIEDLISGGIYVLEADSTVIRALVELRHGAQCAPASKPQPVSAANDIGRLVLQGHHLITHEMGLDDDSRAQGGAPHPMRRVDLAIERRGRLLGVLELGFTGRGTFGEDEIRIYQGIAAILGNAIGNARSYEAEVRNARISDAVGRILGASMRAPSEEALGRECLDVIEAITDSSFGFVASLAADGHLENVAYSDIGWDQCTIEASSHRNGHARWPLAGLYGHALSHGETVISNDPLTDNRRAGLPEGHPPLTSFMGTPLVGKSGEMFGIVALGNRPGGYSRSERDAVEALAPAVVEAIERFRAERQLAEDARLADELSHIESIIHASLDVDRVAEEALRTGRDALRADSASLSLYEPPNFRIVHAIGYSREVCGSVIPEGADEHAARAIRTRRPALVNEFEADSEGDALHRRDVRAMMAIPLFAGGTAFGVVCYNFAEPRQFSEPEVRFALRLSLSLSLAMENARLYETERMISNRLQEALLALPEVVPGVEFAHAYYPATEGAKVGGDFYDIFELSYGHVGITVGDVAGKGVDAAALTSLVKNTIRAHASERGKTPAQILRLTNEMLYKTTPMELFVTVFFGILDCRDGRFVYANGGHPTAAVVRRDAETARLHVTGPLLGALPDIELEHGQTHVDPDDTLFLYTDGLTEARRSGELYGEDRLFTLLAQVPDRGPRQLMHSVVAEVMSYSRGRLRDDLALLVVRRTGDAPGHPVQSKFEV